MIGLIIFVVWLFAGYFMTSLVGEENLGYQIFILIFWPVILLTILAIYIKHEIERRQ